MATIDKLFRTHDYYPQIIGILDIAASGVTIQIWDVTGGDNTQVNLIDNVCYSIGTTARWGWSTFNLPHHDNRKRHYFYRMTSNIIDDIFEGQFFINIPENANWIHPSNMNEYLL